MLQLQENKRPELIPIDSFLMAIREYNKQRNGDACIPMDSTYSQSEMLDIIESNRLNVLYIFIGAGTLFNPSLSESNYKFLEIINELLLDGQDIDHLLINLDLNEKHLDKFWKDELKVKDRHWKPLIQRYNVNPLYAFAGSTNKYLD